MLKEVTGLDKKGNWEDLEQQLEHLHSKIVQLEGKEDRLKRIFDDFMDSNNNENKVNWGT